MNEIKEFKKLGSVLNDIIGQDTIVCSLRDKSGKLTHAITVGVNMIAKYVIEAGYGNISEYKAEIERLRTTLDQLNAEHNSALETLKSQCREIGELQAENKRLKAKNNELHKKIAELEQDLIHIDENVFYHECAVSLDENKIKKQAQTDMLAIFEKGIKAYTEQCYKKDVYDFSTAMFIQSHVGIVLDIMRKQTTSPFEKQGDNE